MGRSNNALRDTAIPYLGQIMGYNRNEQSDQDITKADRLGDLNNIANSFILGTGGSSNIPGVNNMIRILRPRYGKIVEAYLTLVIITANAETAPSFQISAGTGFSSGVIPVIPPPDQVLAIHKALTGSATPFQNTAGLPIVVEKLSLSKLIPQVGDPNYNEDCFVIGIHFPQIPNNGTGYRLVNFMVDGSALVTRN